MLEVFLDALIDSLKVLAVVFILNIILALLEEKISNSNSFLIHNKFSPIVGSLSGLIPQCGLSVVAADMYKKSHITMGTLIAIFISCSDEALPLLLSDKNKILSIIPIILIKFVVGFIVGYLVDVIISKKDVEEHLDDCHHEKEVHTGCCHHKIDDHDEKKIIKYLLHPLIHSLKIFIYVLIVNLIFGYIIYYVGDDKISNFLHSNKYITPILSILVGMIPNCASSVIITELYISSYLSFGALISGLIMNAGLGMIILFRDKESLKKIPVIWGIMILTALTVGYICCLINGF